LTENAEKQNMSPARKEPDTSTYSGRFAVRLRSLREKAGLTHEEVATAMSVTLNTIYHWEQGKHFPKPDQLPQLMEILKLKTVWALFPKR
jgi:transcriptional regulator with XRE-family HTH domain